MQLRTYLKNRYGRAPKYINKHIINKNAYYANVTVLDINNCEFTFNFYVSKNMNDCINRYRGFNLNRAANNGICLYQADINFYLHYDNGTFTDIDNIKWL